MIIRVLPEQPERVETGVTRFGGEWPGVFLRGDYAIPMGRNLAGIAASLKHGERVDYGSIVMLQMLADRLMECDMSV